MSTDNPYKLYNAIARILIKTEYNEARQKIIRKNKQANEMEIFNGVIRHALKKMSSLLYMRILCKLLFFVGALIMIFSGINIALYHDSSSNYPIMSIISLWSTIIPSFIIPLFIAVIPTIASTQIEEMHDKNGLPITGADNVLCAAYELLKKHAENPSATIKYTSSTPFFGLYTHTRPNSPDASEKAKEWRNLIEKRADITANHPFAKTIIVSLAWEPFFNGRSPLYTVCKRICPTDTTNHQRPTYTQCKNTNTDACAKTTEDIYLHALSDWNDYIDIIKNKRLPRDCGLKTYITHTPFDVFVFLVSTPYETTSIIAHIHHNNHEFQMSGFQSSNERWTNTAQHIFDSLTNTAQPGSKSFEITQTLRHDDRTEKQRNRDMILLHHFCKTSHQDRNVLTPGQKFTLLTDRHYRCIIENKYVFPMSIFIPQKKKWTESMQKIRAVLLNIQGDSCKKIVAVDINTGCGIIALTLLLEQGISKIHAIEHDSKAMANALMNHNRILELIANDPGKRNQHILNTNKISFHCGRGIRMYGEECNCTTDYSSLKKIPLESDNATDYLIIYNYIYYESFFCTMNYQYRYKYPPTRKLATAPESNFYIDDHMGQSAFATVVSDIISDTVLKSKNIYIMIPYCGDLIKWDTITIETDKKTFSICTPMSILEYFEFSAMEASTTDANGGCVYTYRRLAKDIDAKEIDRRHDSFVKAFKIKKAPPPSIAPPYH